MEEYSYDTTAVNNRRLSGVVVKIQNDMEKFGYSKPKFIGCQHHILDTILRHILNNLLDGSTKKHQINYKFMNELIDKYPYLQEKYLWNETLPNKENLGWRADFKLCHSFRFYKVS